MLPKKKSTYLYIGIALVVYIVCVYIAARMSYFRDLDPSLSVINAFMETLFVLGQDFGNVSFGRYFWGSVGAVTLVYAIAACFIYVEYEREKNTLHGKENGSAGWNTDYDKYNKNYTAPYGRKECDPTSNAIISQEVALGMNGGKTMRNINTLIVGGSGSGKSRFYVKPNMLQFGANCSYVVTDPSGELVRSMGSALEKNGYKIKVFNLVNMRYSNRYNPFEYIRDDTGVMMLINCLIKNTTPGGAGKGDPFWEKSETALLQALIFYLIKYRPKNEQNFTSVMKLLRAAEVDENNPNAKSPLDKLFEEVQKKDPNSIALKQYQTFKMGAGKTLKSILISCSVRLTVFNLEQIENLTRVDDLELSKIGDEKTALFVIIPQADDTYNFLASMLYSQLFETLYFHAEHECPNGKLPYHVRFLLDEFANIGQIPDFVKKLATMRKYEISCSIILQNLAQIKAAYKDDWEGMVGNCDAFLFLGGQEFSTLEYISKELGKATIKGRNTSRSRGGKTSDSISYNATGRELMTPDELMRMDNNHCVVMVRGLKPFYCHKYDYTNHPNYKLTGDADPSQEFLIDQKPEFDNAPRIDEKVLENALRKGRADAIIGRPVDAKQAVLNDLRNEMQKERSAGTDKAPDSVTSSLLSEEGMKEISFAKIDNKKSEYQKDMEEKQKEEEAAEEDQEEWMFSTS